MSSDDAAAFAHDGGDVGVLLCHGFTGSPQSMRPWADHLAAQGFTVRLPLLPGHGTRWQDANRTTFADWLGAVTDSLAELAGRCRSVVVAGLSMGGTLTLRLAELHPGTIAGIVVVNPSILSLRKDVKYLLPLLKYVVGAQQGIASDIADPAASEDGYDRTPLRAMDSLRRAWPVVRADLGSITMPVLLLHSRVDHVVEPENSAALLAEIGSSDVTEVVLERSYHVATLDYDAPEIFARSVEFIRRVTGAIADGKAGAGVAGASDAGAIGTIGDGAVGDGAAADGAVGDGAPAVILAGDGAAADGAARPIAASEAPSP
jgi:carboxylesterase